MLTWLSICTKYRRKRFYECRHLISELCHQMPCIQSTSMKKRRQARWLTDPLPSSKQLMSKEERIIRPHPAKSQIWSKILILRPAPSQTRYLRRFLQLWWTKKSSQRLMSWGNQARHKDTRIISRSVPRSIALASWSSGRIRSVKASKMLKPQPNRLGSAKVSSNINLLQKMTKTAKTSIFSLKKTLELMVFENSTNNRKLLKWYQSTRQRTKWCQMI